MTTQQKDAILAMRRNGASYIEIAQRLCLSVNTVKSYGRRCEANMPGYEPLTDGQRRCECCDKVYPQPSHRKQKRFCSDDCRFKWWQKNKALSKRAVAICCPGCGGMFMARSGQKFCQHACYVAVRFGGTHHVQHAV